MLKLNLILNGLVASLDNAIQGNTMTEPYHKNDAGTKLRQFDFVVSNPPFNMDFSEDKERMDAQPARFWGGIPNIKPKKPKNSVIYPCFIQHVVNSIKENGKGAIVVPTGFLTAKSGVERTVLEYIVDEKIVYGAISMPQNVFANTGTNVSVLFFDKSKKNEKVILIKADDLGEEYKEGKNKKRRLAKTDIDRIIETFEKHEELDEFSVYKSYEEIKAKNYSLAAGQYFDVKVERVELTVDEFNKTLEELRASISKGYERSHSLEKEILNILGELHYGD